VLDDADLDDAVRAAVTARFVNCGQVCLAAKRFILTPRIAEELEQRFAIAASALRIGNPLDRTTQLGPMAALMRARNAEEALSLANGSAYGLGCVMWTRDIERARALARRAAPGSVFINGVTASDPRLPVGGVKLSGYGRELGAAGIGSW